MGSDRWVLDPSSRRVALDVLRRGPISRAALGRALGLSSGSLTRITKPMVASGFLVQGAPVGAAAGRPSLPLDVDASAAHFVGVTIVVGRMYGVLTDLKGHVVGEATLDGDWRTSADAVAAIASLVARFSAAAPVLGIGVTLGAAVDGDGSVRGAEFLGWPTTPLATFIAERTGIPATAENDVNAYAVAEHWFGTGRGCSEFAVLTIGAGVGLGLVCNDQLVVGHHGAAGMIGFARLPDGREARGVVESAAIARRVSAVLERPVAYGQIAALAQTDARVAAVLDDVADAVGQLAGLVALVTSPERLLISGDGVALIADRRHRVRSVFGRLSLAYVTPPSLHLAEVGFREWARGAAAVAIRRHMAPLD